MSEIPTTIDFPRPLEATRRGKHWHVRVDGRDVRLSNLDKVFWGPEGYTKADLVAYYLNAAPHALPYVADRPLTLKRMPDGADGEFFYAKQAPAGTPAWVRRAAVTSLDTGKTTDYLVADDTASLLWLANLGCIELHPWHSRVDDIARPDYAFFDLDPFDVGFDVVRQVALVVGTALDRLGLRGYPRTSGATGIQIYVPIDRVHGYGQVREWVGRICRLVNDADPERTTMEWSIADRSGKVFLDHNMNTEGRNIAAAFSVRPERRAPVSTPLRWEELEGDVEPTDFTIADVWNEIGERDGLFRPVLAGGQDLRAAMEAIGMRPDPSGAVAGHRVEPAAPTALGTALDDYAAKRDFSRTPEPGPGTESGTGVQRFVIQHHLATRLHHDLRLERDGTLPSWAVPKGLPDIPGLRHLAVRTEDHPLEYLEFSGEIPADQYGGGTVRIWDQGTYELLEWRDDKVTVRLHGQRHHGTYHLFRTDQDWLVTRSDEPGPDELVDAPPRLEPMLAVAADRPVDDPGWSFEVKWDGIRVIATTVRPGAGQAAVQLFSRQGNDISAGYPELASLWERVLARNAALDGEIVAFGPDGLPSFERLQQRMHTRDPGALERLRKQVPVTLMVFDLLAVDGRSLISLPLHERYALLDEVLVPGPQVQRSEAVTEHGVALFEAVTQRGLEGIVAKRSDSRYEPGRRSRAWRKIKVRKTMTTHIGGWLAGEGGRSGQLGSLLAGTFEQGKLRYRGRVGTGFDAKELARLGRLLEPLAADDSPFTDGPPPPRAGRWVRPVLACTVEYAELTAAGLLRAPSYKGLVNLESGQPGR